jgi:hypothetical protein
MYPCGPRIQSSKSILSSSPTLFVEFVVSVYPLDGNSQDWHLHGSRTATGTNCTVHVLHVLVPRGTVPVRNSSIVPVRNSSPDNCSEISIQMTFVGWWAVRIGTYSQIVALPNGHISRIYVQLENFGIIPE